MDGFGTNPFGILTFIVAPAILTNASSVMALGTANRFARAIDRARALSAQVEGQEHDPDPQIALRLRQLRVAERRVLLLVRALTAFYVSVGSFAAASLISLLGAAFFIVSYSVSHDLRAPLRAIDGFSRILLEEHAEQLSDEAQEYLRLVRDNTQQMGGLVDDLLSFSRLSRQEIRKQTVAPARIVQQCLEDLRGEQNGRRVAITVGDLPSCKADPSLLKQVWFNLLANALKYTRKRDAALVEVGSRCDRPGERTYFVRGNGVGFDMQYAGKLFGVFQRLHRAEDYEGIGVWA